MEGGGLLHPVLGELSIFLGGDQIAGAGGPQVAQRLADVPGQEATAAHQGLKLPGEVGQPLKDGAGVGRQVLQGEAGAALPEGFEVQIFVVGQQGLLAEGYHAVPVGDAVDLLQMVPGGLAVLPAQAVGDGGEVGLPGVLQRGQAGGLPQGGDPGQQKGEGFGGTQGGGLEGNGGPLLLKLDDRVDQCHKNTPFDSGMRLTGAC